MAAKEIRFGEDARAKMVRGVNVLANAVKATTAIKTTPVQTRMGVVARPRNGDDSPVLPCITQ